MRTLGDIDRSARGLERAVLSWSLTGGDRLEGRECRRATCTAADRIAILLDRSVASLAGVRRWLAEVPGANRELVRDYLVMTALTLCGRDLDIDQIPSEVDTFERWLSSCPRRGTPWRRPRTIAISFTIDTGHWIVPSIREFALRAIPALADAEEFDDEDDPWSFAMVVDQDELRLDLEENQLILTVTVDLDDVERECDRLYRAFADHWATVFAVARDLDEAESIGYVLRGLDGGLPRYFFYGDELAGQPGAVELVGSDPRAFRAPASRSLIAALGLSPTWPHVDIG